MLVVRLLAEVEVRGDRVLEEVHEEVAREEEGGSVRGEPHALGHELQQHGGEHEARAERDEVA
jgi:hypothetical protein